MLLLKFGSRAGYQIAGRLLTSARRRPAPGLIAAAFSSELRDLGAARLQGRDRARFPRRPAAASARRRPCAGRRDRAAPSAWPPARCRTSGAPADRPCPRACARPAWDRRAWRPPASAGPGSLPALGAGGMAGRSVFALGSCPRRRYCPALAPPSTSIRIGLPPRLRRRLPLVPAACHNSLVRYGEAVRVPPAAAGMPVAAFIEHGELAVSRQYHNRHKNILSTIP